MQEAVDGPDAGKNTKKPQKLKQRRHNAVAVLLYLGVRNQPAATTVGAG